MAGGDVGALFLFLRETGDGSDGSGILFSTWGVQPPEESRFSSAPETSTEFRPSSQGPRSTSAFSPRFLADFRPSSEVKNAITKSLGASLTFEEAFSFGRGVGFGEIGEELASTHPARKKTRHGWLPAIPGPSLALALCEIGLVIVGVLYRLAR